MPRMSKPRAPKADQSPSEDLGMGWQPRTSGKLPPLVPPEGPGYMPLYCAAQYIATRDGTVEIDPE